MHGSNRFAVLLLKSSTRALAVVVRGMPRSCWWSPLPSLTPRSEVLPTTESTLEVGVGDGCWHEILGSFPAKIDVSLAYVRDASCERACVSDGIVLTSWSGVALLRSLAADVSSAFLRLSAISTAVAVVARSS